MRTTAGLSTQESKKKNDWQSETPARLTYSSFIGFSF
jgi:hypothetical protein